MTAQHVPHTPLWRRVLSLPHTPLGQWTIGLTVGSVLLLIFGLFLNVFAGLGVSSWAWMILIAGILAGAVVGLLALLRSPQHETERSAVEEAQSRQREEERKQARLDKLMVRLGVGLGVLLALPLVGLPIVFLAQWLKWMLRHKVVPIVPFVLYLVAMMAVIAALHFLQRGKEGYGLRGTVSSVASFVGVALILGGALIGYVSQDWLLATNLMGGGLVVSTIGVAGLAIVSLLARVVPWWGGAALIAGNPFLPLVWFSPLGPHLGGIWLVVVPWVVVGVAVLIAARRRTQRPARVG
jgi:MFS family permease